MMLKTLRWMLPGILFATLPLALPAAVKPAPLFSDNMVLQAGQPVPVWGWADDGEVVTIKFRNQKVTTTARNLGWHLKLGKLKAGGPDVFTISTKSDNDSIHQRPRRRRLGLQRPVEHGMAAEPVLRARRRHRFRDQRDDPPFQCPRRSPDAPTTVVKATWQSVHRSASRVFRPWAIFSVATCSRRAACPWV